MLAWSASSGTPMKPKWTSLPMRAPTSKRMPVRPVSGPPPGAGFLSVAVANAILLVTFAERERRAGAGPIEAAVKGARSRLRPILMTSLAMLAGMLPMAAGWSEGGEQMAPLGRAVMGGLGLATVATLLVLPAFYALLAAKTVISSSLDPEDPASRHRDVPPDPIQVTR